MNDTRAIQALDDVKAGTAALDDARGTLVDLLAESPPFSERDIQALEANQAALSRMLLRANAVIGSMTRILERNTHA